MQFRGGRKHWHPDHPDGWENPRQGNLKHWREHLRRLGLKFPDVEIINATRETALSCFPQMPLKEALC
jgi:hypothetical protein